MSTDFSTSTKRNEMRSNFFLIKTKSNLDHRFPQLSKGDFCKFLPLWQQ